MYPFVIAVGAVSLLFLVLRFVQPQLIYWIRESLAQVRMNKAFLKADNGDYVEIYPELLVADMRREGVPRTIQGILNRVTKIRELYAIFDAGRERTVKQSFAHGVNVCSLELTNIMYALAKRVEPRLDIQASPIRANDILVFLANQSENVDGLPDNADSDVIVEFFEDHPISIEQINEILIACIYATSCRLTSRNDFGTDGEIVL